MLKMRVFLIYCPILLKKQQDNDYTHVFKVNV
jgi:hypothetical protein